MTKNMDVYEKVRSVPPEALKPIIGGRLKGMSDINPMWRLKTLTEVFGMCGVGWKTVITDRKLERGHGEEVVCFVNIDLYVKVNGEWSEAIPGMGGSSFVTMERNGAYTSDECFKMAYTDAIGVACKSLGFAADVYFEKDRTKYMDGDNDSATAPQRPYVVPSTPAVPNTPSHNPPPAVGTALITEPQMKMVQRMKNEKKLTDDQYRDLLSQFGVSSTKDLTKSSASKIIERLTSWMPVPIDIASDDLPF